VAYAPKLQRRSAEAKVIPIGENPVRRAGLSPFTWRRKSFLLLVAAVACLLGFALVRYIGVRHAGRLEYSMGLARVIRAGRALDSAQPAEFLHKGDILETGNGTLAASIDGRVQLLMNEKSRVSLSGGGRIALDAGEVWLYVEPGSGGFAVQTHGCSIHVAGTSFGIRTDDSGVTVVVSSGKVIVRSDTEEVGVSACEKIHLTVGKGLSSAELFREGQFSRPPAWVDTLLKKISMERWRKFFPSAVPIVSDAP
ncbi:MAG: FecR family protein, partial [Candidatus Sumerlaeota bacterium]|nr:FecR family protein [Candidatus Sumerlaeota bacterium]